MYRSASLVAMVLVAVTLVSAVPLPKDVKTAVKPWQATRENLDKPVTFDAIEANTPFKEALAFASERRGVTMLLDTDAFTAAGIQEPENHPVKLPKMTDVRFESWLRQLTREAQADFYVQPDGIIWIVPRDAVVKHIMAQKVTASFEKQPVTEVLRKMADSMGLSIVVDEKRAGDKAKTPVTVDLRNVTLEAAILMVADLADLKPVTIDRAVYVTTRENAREIRAEVDRKNAEKEVMPEER